jgi:Domain of unknown function (DUF5597)
MKRLFHVTLGLITTILLPAAVSGVVNTFQPAIDDEVVAGILSMEEGRFVGGQWTPGRRMNGDQDHQGRQMHLPGGAYGIQKVRLYRYK